MTEQDKKDLTELLQGSKVFTYSEEVRLSKFRDEIALKALIAPAVILAEMVPDDIPKNVYQVIYQECGGFVESNANAQTIWKACRAAILRKIEERC